MSKTVHLQIDQASSFSKQLTAKNPNGTAIDLTNYTIKGSIKKMFQTYTGKSFSVTTNDAPNGVFTISLTDEETGSLAAGTYVYDITIEDTNGIITRIFDGKVHVDPAVTGANPFVTVGGMALQDPRVVHIHENKDALDQITDVSQVPSVWKPVTSNYVAENGDRLMVDTTGGQVIITVPDQPAEDYKFQIRVMDLKENFGVASVLIQNESATAIYEETATGADFEIVWTDVATGYKIIQ